MGNFFMGLMLIAIFVIWVGAIADLITNENYDGFVKTIGVILFVIQPWAIIPYYIFANHKKKCEEQTEPKEVTE